MNQIQKLLNLSLDIYIKNLNPGSSVQIAVLSFSIKVLAHNFTYEIIGSGRFLSLHVGLNADQILFVVNQ